MVDSVLDTGWAQPAEWEPHVACWLAWPTHVELWGDSLPATQASFVALCEGIAHRTNHGEHPPEKLRILVADDTAGTAARAALGHLNVEWHVFPYGDIWLRDTAPIFLQNAAGQSACSTFAFNGWGGKYTMGSDHQVAEFVAKTSGFQTFNWSWVLEGGSVEVDGQGTCLTTRQCLLNPNRDAQLSETQAEHRLRQALGVEQVIWLEEGLLNDHTDGHIDTLARFVAPGVVVCMEPLSSSDPNYDVMKQIHKELSQARDHRGRKLEVFGIPSPGEVFDEEGELMPASYMNFYIANQQVIVPTYGSENDDKAVEALAKLFPSRTTVGVYGKPILVGGGAFHCITQQQPGTFSG
jgi:agmatine deiminase